ncbi:MAG: rod shape-determining protein MreD [Endomicrobium sp.]|jgi:rod shape-determining protein MreD|nr:rod shape-determining protein MreD [Endomicrobium sp.]
MKKPALYFFIYIVFCLLQFFLNQYLNVFGISPNFILVLIVCIGLMKGSFDAQIIGFWFGFTWDVFSTDIFTTRAMLFTMLGYFSGKLDKKFDADNIFFQCAIVLVTSLVYNLGIYLVSCIIMQNNVLWCSSNISVLKSISKILATVAITPFVFYVLRRVLKGM